MAAKLVPTSRGERMSKLFQQIQRYDIDDLLAAATHTTLHGWPVMSRDEKRDIEKQGGSKREKFDRLFSLVTKSADRMTRFAKFIKWYTSPIQEAVDAVLECQDSPAAVDSVKTVAESGILMVTNSRAQMQNAKLMTSEADQRNQKPLFSDSSSTARRTIQFVDTGSANSQEQYSTEIRDNLMGSQINNLSSGSQKLSDIGYSSGLSKDFQSPNLPVGGASLSTLQSNLEVIKRNHQSRQLKMQQRHLDATKHQHITHFHQPVVVHHHYHIPGKEEQQTNYDDQWPPLLARYSRDIIRSLKMEDLVPHLVEKRLLTKNEFHELNTYPSWKQSEHYVLKILPTKGEDGWKKFLECLKEEEEHSGHQDLFRLLKN